MSILEGGKLHVAHLTLLIGVGFAVASEMKCKDKGG
jgi:hypothetical protein